MKLDDKNNAEGRPDKRRRYVHESPPPLPLGASRSPSPSHLVVRHAVPLRRHELYRRHNSNHRIASCNRSRLPSARAEPTPAANNQSNPNIHSGPNLALPLLVSSDNARTSQHMNAGLVSSVPPPQAGHHMYNNFDEPCNSNVRQSRPGHRRTEGTSSENSRLDNHNGFVPCSSSALPSDNSRRRCCRSPSADSISDLSS